MKKKTSPLKRKRLKRRFPLRKSHLKISCPRFKTREAHLKVSNI